MPNFTEDEYARMCTDILKVAMGNLDKPANFNLARAAMLTSLSTLYCMAESVPDAVNIFRSDIPAIEKCIRHLFGGVYPMTGRG